MRLMVGLGNPGPKYRMNRHNIGFMAVDEIVRRHGFGPWRKNFQAEVSEGHIAGEKILCMKPTTYMNESGRAVGEALRFHKLNMDDVIVFHDELDLPAGKLRIKLGGGHAGHNGLRSIDAHIGKEYHRIRLGIGHPGRKDLVHAYVLHDFAKADVAWLEPLIDDVAREAASLAEGRFDQFQNRIALTMQPILDKLLAEDED
jgi:PTH1 family peptidyl-tRNA hydrolase